MPAIPPKTNLDGIVHSAAELIDAAFKRGVKHGRYLEQQEQLQAKMRLQKPLMLEDVKQGEVLFVEFRDDWESDVERVEIIEGLAPNFVGYAKIGWACRFNIDKISYGRFWRAWSSRPTNEERLAAKWEV